ncbi:MAG TPA: sulfatase [Planctomycetaceae bacterium]|nr:sulfatase [Planctomycetaceae bacterium]
MLACRTSLTQSACLIFAAVFFPVIATAATPNVVIILGDDQAWTDYGFMGHPVIQTPHLDRLAKESATFVRGYGPTSLCRPSLASLITGRYPHEHKIAGNDPPKGTPRTEMLRHIHRLPTLPKWLGEQGYLSLQTGKWWEGNYKEGGFTHGMTHGDPSKGGRHGDEGLKIGRQGLAPIAEFLDQRGDKPFFLWYAPMLPHTPHNPPERLFAKYRAADRPPNIARYYAMCEWWDETVGEVLGMLEQRKLTENTLVIYLTDNGWIQQPQANGYAPKSKRSPYDGGLRTPILVKWPGKVTPARYDTPVSALDVAPTILTAAGIMPPNDLPGINLMEIARANGKSDRTALFGEVLDHDVADIDHPAASLQYRWLLSEGRWKLILPNPAGTPEKPDLSPTPELYDVLADPHESQNLAADHPDRVTELTKQLNTWWTPTR